MTTTVSECGSPRSREFAVAQYHGLPLQTHHLPFRPVRARAGHQDANAILTDAEPIFFDSPPAPFLIPATTRASSRAWSANGAPDFRRTQVGARSHARAEGPALHQFSVAVAQASA